MHTRAGSLVTMLMFAPHMPCYAALMYGNDADDCCYSAVGNGGDCLNGIGRCLRGHDSDDLEEGCLFRERDIRAKAIGMGVDIGVNKRVSSCGGLAAF